MQTEVLRTVGAGPLARPAKFTIKVSTHPLQTEDAPLPHHVERRLSAKGQIGLFNPRIALVYIDKEMAKTLVDAQKQRNPRAKISIHPDNC